MGEAVWARRGAVYAGAGPGAGRALAPADSSTLAAGTPALLKGSLLGLTWFFPSWSRQVRTHLHGRLMQLLNPSSILGGTLSAGFWVVSE